MSSYYSNGGYANGAAADTIDRSPIKQLEDDVVPSNPLATAMNQPVMSIGGLINKMRMKALTTQQAFDIYHGLVVTRLRQQAEVLAQNGELVASAKKLEALDLFKAHGHEVAKRLFGRLVDLTNTMTGQEFQASLAAEEEAAQDAAAIERRFQEGAIDEAAKSRLLLRIEAKRHFKTEAFARWCGEFLEQQDRQLKLTLRNLDVASERHLIA